MDQSTSDMGSTMAINEEWLHNKSRAFREENSSTRTHFGLAAVMCIALALIFGVLLLQDASDDWKILYWIGIIVAIITVFVCYRGNRKNTCQKKIFYHTLDKWDKWPMKMKQRQE